MSPGEWLGLHGLVLRARDPRALAARLSRLLGWSALGAARGEIVLGTGPEMFLWIRRDRRAGDRIVLEEIHLATRDIAGRRRKAKPDAMGGDSWSWPVAAGLSIAARQFKRPPRGKWRPRRKPR